MKGYSTFLKASELGPHCQMQFSVKFRTLVGSGCLTFLQRCSRRILQLQLTGEVRAGSISESHNNCYV